MLFKYPSVLYSFLVLLIPVLIHLFKLRKFQKTTFTNVLFLEKIKIQSRKSSKLKKWLILLSRLAIFSFLIVAFAFPYLPSQKKAPEKYIIYLDNSFSMQIKGENGPLLSKAIQDIISKFKETESFSLFTNTTSFENVNLSEIQNDLLDIDYSEEQLSYNEILLQFKKLSKTEANSALIVISDFQSKNDSNYKELVKNSAQIIQLQPQNTNNVSIDSLWITSIENQKILKIKTSSSYSAKDINLSVKNGDKLIGKVNLDFSKNEEIVTDVPLQNNLTINGVVTLENTLGLKYDDKRYFSLNEVEKPNILVIGDAYYRYLQKIYDPKNFSLVSVNSKAIIKQSLSNYNLIILNECEIISNELKQKINAFTKSGGTLCIIPTSETNADLKELLSKYYNVALNKYIDVEKKITTINFQHYLFDEVFTKKISNFQYPTVKKSYLLDSKNWVLRLEDNTPFLIQNDHLFIFSTPLNQEFTNFKNSPLIVPVFYNIAHQNRSLNKINYTIGEKNEIIIETNIGQDDVLHIKNENQEFIPLQHAFKNYVKITTQEFPSKAGNYNVFTNNKNIQQLSFNYNTKESNLIYADLNTISKNKYSNSISNYFNSSKASFETTDLWKWFLIFALFFLLIEIILLKYL